MSVDPKTGIANHLRCISCLRDNLQSDIDIGVSRDGALILWCMNHDAPVAVIPNSRVAQRLRDIAGSECDGPHHYHMPEGHFHG